MGRGKLVEREVIVVDRGAAVVKREVIDGGQGVTVVKRP